MGKPAFDLNQKARRWMGEEGPAETESVKIHQSAGMHLQTEPVMKPGPLRSSSGAGAMMQASTDSDGHIPMAHRFIKPALLLGFLLIGSAAHAQSSTGRSGMLTCRMAPSVGFIIGSSQKLSCQYKDNAGWTQNYAGRMNRIGLDIGITAGGVMAWGVIGSTNAIRPGSLAGKFVGASGEVSLGVGAGANLLVGGTAQGISLQPLSVEGQVGVNLALGVAGLTLSPVR
jgi:hypothetical protein